VAKGEERTFEASKTEGVIDRPERPAAPPSAGTYNGCDQNPCPQRITSALVGATWSLRCAQTARTTEMEKSLARPSKVMACVRRTHEKSNSDS